MLVTIRLLWSTACRLGEIAGLVLQDISDRRRVGKSLGNLNLEWPWSPSQAAHCCRWLSIYHVALRNTECLGSINSILSHDARRLLIEGARVSEREELFRLVVPKMQSGVGKAFADRHAVGICQCTVIAQDIWQSIKGDTAVKVMNVMNADIGGEPTQHRWQHVVGASVQSGLVQLPVFVGFPMRGFKLMLHIEQPDTGRGGQQCGRQENQQNWHQAAKIHDDAQSNEYPGIGRHGTEPEFTLFHETKGQSVLK